MNRINTSGPIMVKAFAGLLAVLVLVGAGCNPMDFFARKASEIALERATGGKADVDYKGDGTVTINTNEGTFSTGTKVPDNWPSDVAVYPGSSVQYSGSSNQGGDGKLGFALLLASTDSPAKVAEYYNKSLVAAGWKINSTANFGGASIIGAEKDNRTLAITIGEGDKGSSAINIAVGVK